ncbi:hypothetical protein [Flammeovirga aprica]|uniref:Uncharacterized protein n=1 Tax=Flammeovirga aprica JL-4 TaxID=694437 RepID=A0A7X9XDJ8_9BACT|nr:hypothetical protein [Flammeovirga aprica]NME72971.1 hypothetical protein [Flammeovirga aprica JL-4]
MSDISELEAIVNELSVEKLKNYVINYAETNEIFKREFLYYFAGKSDDQLRIDFYREKIQIIFYKYAHRGFIDYKSAGNYADEINDMLTIPADRLCNRGIYYEAFSMLAANVLELQKGFESVEYEVELSDIFTDCIDTLQNLLSKKIPLDLLQKIYEWLEKEAENPIYADYVYEDADRLKELKLKAQGMLEAKED